MKAVITSGTQDYSKLPDDWEVAVKRRGIDVTALYAAVDDIYGAGATPAVSPRFRRDVFRAFHRTPLELVRVVIVGEDPYPDPDQAHGLAFSVAGTYLGRRPTSLGRIFGSLRRDLKIFSTSNDLTEWADRGVLLLNVALTHEIGKPAPDLKSWGAFTTAVLDVVNAKTDPVAWLLWGDFAVDHADSIPVNNPKHKRFENAHPRAGRAIRPLLSQRPPFSSASAFLGSDPNRDWKI